MYFKKILITAFATLSVVSACKTTSDNGDSEIKSSGKTGIIAKLVRHGEWPVTTSKKCTIKGDGSFETTSFDNIEGIKAIGKNNLTDLIATNEYLGKSTSASNALSDLPDNKDGLEFYLKPEGRSLEKVFVLSTKEGGEGDKSWSSDSTVGKGKINAALQIVINACDNP